MNPLNEDRLKHVKRQATNLVSRLTELGVTVKRSQALEGIAAINGYPGWNHFSAALNSALAPAVDDPASTVIASISDGGLSNLVRKVASGFPYLCDQEFTLVCMGTGQGKSTVLYHCMADAAERNATFIYLDFANGDEVPKHFRDKAHFISVFEEGGEIKEVISSNGIGEVVIVNLNLRVRKIDPNWFADFMFRLIDSLPTEFISRLAYVLADEFDKAGLNNPELRKAFRILLDTANESKLPNEGAKVVLAGKYIEESIGYIPCSLICDTRWIKEIRSLSKYCWDNKDIAQVYLVDHSELYESAQLDLGDRASFIRNISKFARSRLFDKRNSTAFTESLFVKNDKFRYFENAERQLLSSKPRG